jgi:hypothetical protein
MKKIFFILLLSLFFVPYTALAAQAALSLISSAGVYQVKKDFTVRLIVNSGGSVGINTVGAALKFKPTEITVKKISKTGSIFKYWPVEPSFSNKDGYIAISGGSPKAFKDTAGGIVDITFTPVKLGKTTIEFSKNKLVATSSVLTADGIGTNILSARRKSTYIIGTYTDALNAKNMVKKLSGRILIEVQKNGEAWYIYPNDLKRYYLGRPADAFSIMRKLGLGVNHSYITKYKIFPKTVSGKILIDTEDKGKAYYINPLDLKAYYLGRPADAFSVMRKLGLGITNIMIDKIPDWAI